MDIFRPTQYAYMPEPSSTPPECTRHQTANCGHEVSPGDEDSKGRPANFMIEWVGQTRIIEICPDCLNDKWDDLTVEEKAELFSCKVREVV